MVFLKMTATDDILVLAEPPLAPVGVLAGSTDKHAFLSGCLPFQLSGLFSLPTIPPTAPHHPPQLQPVDDRKFGRALREGSKCKEREEEG